LRGRYRFQLLIKGAGGEDFDRCARALAKAATRLPKGVRAAVDANPGSML
jgi:primosomal protein N'